MQSQLAQLREEERERIEDTGRRLSPQSRCTSSLLSYKLPQNFPDLWTRNLVITQLGYSPVPCHINKDRLVVFGRWLLWSKGPDAARLTCLVALEGHTHMDSLSSPYRLRLTYLVSLRCLLGFHVVAQGSRDQDRSCQASQARPALAWYGFCTLLAWQGIEAGTDSERVGLDPTSQWQSYQVICGHF